MSTRSREELINETLQSLCKLLAIAGQPIVSYTRDQIRVGDLVFETSTFKTAVDPDRIGWVRALSANGDDTIVEIIVLSTGETKRWSNADFIRIPWNDEERRKLWR